ncbi:SIS domain-containing protein [Telmatobacter sp. DSM 110680]|uniref:Glutamine--fructose-6-phosphate aminotransferase [isomerizing] n=1 Tax=Telmatobacter sp. DSM 110680 TaxID=3036704 RepID=A0AAU7DII1_9BACT
MNEFPHAMLREIFEQPAAIRRTLDLYLDGENLKTEAFAPYGNWLNERGEVLIAASGSSRHAGLAAEIIFEDLCGLAVDVEYASEYSCRPAVNPRRPSVLVISQSGETSDTLAALRFAKDRGEQTLAIANVIGSTMLREAGAAMPLAAGKELAIPATKSFTCQLTALYLLALFEGSKLGVFDKAQFGARVAELCALPGVIERQLEGWRERMTALAAKYNDAESFLYLGRGVHYAIAREGALKMKESSYVQAEGYPTGELKHGPNALVGEHVPLVALATVDRNVDDSILRYEKTLQLLDDMKKQGARVIAIANTGDHEVPALVTDCVFVEPGSEHLLPVSEVIPLQLFSYAMALERGVNVDRPRNLSKAVIEA